MKRRSAFLLFSILSAGAAYASGYGPLFGYATPTNSKGEWSFDQGLFSRIGGGSQTSLRTLVGYGFTPHLMLDVSAPGIINNSTLPPSRLTPGDEFEVTGAWRFHHRASAVGTRFESTAFGGLIAPGPQGPGNSNDGVFAAVNKHPGLMAGAVTGIASRSHYIW